MHIICHQPLATFQPDTINGQSVSVRNPFVQIGGCLTISEMLSSQFDIPFAVLSMCKQIKLVKFKQATFITRLGGFHQAVTDLQYLNNTKKCAHAGNQTSKGQTIRTPRLNRQLSHELKKRALHKFLSRKYCTEPRWPQMQQKNVIFLVKLFT